MGWAANRLINGREAVSGEDENDDDTARGSRDNVSRGDFDDDGYNCGGGDDSDSDRVTY